MLALFEPESSRSTTTKPSALLGGERGAPGDERVVALLLRPPLLAPVLGCGGGRGLGATARARRADRPALGQRRQAQGLWHWPRAGHWRLLDGPRGHPPRERPPVRAEARGQEEVRRGRRRARGRADEAVRRPPAPGAPLRPLRAGAGVGAGARAGERRRGLRANLLARPVLGARRLAAAAAGGGGAAAPAQPGPGAPRRQAGEPAARRPVGARAGQAVRLRPGDAARPDHRAAGGGAAAPGHGGAAGRKGPSAQREDAPCVSLVAPRAQAAPACTASAARKLVAASGPRFRPPQS